MEEKKEYGLAGILDTYVGVLGLVSGGISYLLFLTAAILSGWVTYLSFQVLGISFISVTLVGATFAISFGLAWFGISILDRIQDAHMLQKVPADARVSTLRSWQRAGNASFFGWAAGFFVGALAGFYVPQAAFVPVLVGIGVGLGNVLFYVIYLVYVRRTDLRPLAVGVYLLATTPLYPYIVGLHGVPDIAAFVLLTVNLSASYLAVSLSYFVEARELVAEVLHAARG
jgi:hypothetical protein